MSRCPAQNLVSVNDEELSVVLTLTYRVIYKIRNLLFKIIYLIRFKLKCSVLGIISMSQQTQLLLMTRKQVINAYVPELDNIFAVHLELSYTYTYNIILCIKQKQKMLFKENKQINLLCIVVGCSLSDILNGTLLLTCHTHLNLSNSHMTVGILCRYILYKDKRC